MTYGSLFSGAGGFDIGIERAGLSPAWQCEIDPQASSVLARHWPKVTRFTDVREIGPNDVGPVDVVIGGFPCQDLSVAGKRKGLSGERSGLFYEMLRVIGLCRPRYVVLENVAGLLSSDDGRDFARVLRGLAECGYFGAWRVLDAKYFGVPQRRRRVFGVFARGHSGALRCGEILALTEGVCRDPQAGSKAGQDVAFTLTSSVARSRKGNRVGNAWNTNYVPMIAETLRASAGRRNGQPAKGWEEGHIAQATFTELGEGHATYQPTDEASSLRTNAGGGGQTANLVARCQTSRNQRIDAESENFVCVTGQQTHAMTAIGADASEDGTGRGTPVVVGTLNANGKAAGSATQQDAESGLLIAQHTGSAVRRLTPRECERLMSWPDDWTRWDDQGNEIADGPRYRMCGNGVVANVAEWIGRRLMAIGGD